LFSLKIEKLSDANYRATKPQLRNHSYEQRGGDSSQSGQWNVQAERRSWGREVAADVIQRGPLNGKCWEAWHENR